MRKNLLVINCDLRETRVALIENGVIAELQIERSKQRSPVGNIVLGKVTRVLPGMQAAFIDVGLERAAFLHVEDLIRPDDFEAYLSGHRRGGGSSDEERPVMSSAAASAAGRHAHEEAAEEEADEEPPPEVLAEEDEGREVPIELPTALDVADAGEELIADEEGNGDVLEDVEAAEAAEAADDEDEPMVAAEAAADAEPSDELAAAAE